MKLPLALALLAAGPALAAPYTFTPLPAGFRAVGLNNLGQISGQKSVASPPGQLNLGVPALYSNGAVTPLDVGTFPSMDAIGGINDAGDFVILENFGGHGEAFAVLGGIVTSIAAPEAQPGTRGVASLNDKRQIVGTTTIFGNNGTPTNQGYISLGATYVLFAVPGARTTEPMSVNNAGQVVGSYLLTSSSAGPQQGFLYDAGAITTIDLPGAVSTTLNGINDQGEVSGTYTDAAGVRHGFTEAGGVFSDVTGPDGSAFLGGSVNNQGQLVGTFGGAGLSYLATPQAVPEPATAAVLGGSLLLLGAIHRRRVAWLRAGPSDPAGVRARSA